MKGFVQKWGRLVPIWAAKTLWTHGSSAILLLDKPAHTWGRLRYVHSACWSTCRQNMWSHTYLTMVKGAHISFHFFSDNIGEPWLRKPMDSATKSTHCRGLARHCRRGRGQETIFYDVFPFIPGMVPTPESSQTNKIITELVVWNIFSHILEIVIPTDFHIFQRGRYTTNQISTWPVVFLAVFHGDFPQWILSSSSLSHGEFILVPNCNSEALFDFWIPKNLIQISYIKLDIYIYIHIMIADNNSYICNHNKNTKSNNSYILYIINI